VEYAASVPAGDDGAEGGTTAWRDDDGAESERRRGEMTTT
jgi:hypothetical protein